jgi:ubiquinone/menaquinone biosynthesis C-methylase UbiE
MTMTDKEKKYTIVTETPDIRGTREQLSRLYTRYKFAAQYCGKKDVLEVACGSGIGLGYLAKTARTVTGGDVDEDNLSYANKTYRDRSNVIVQYLDAHHLPFQSQSFDAVILYEAIYYLNDPSKFLDEAKRLLKNNGVLILCTVNKEWSDFNPSPYSYTYFCGSELYSLLAATGFKDILIYGSCAVANGSVRDIILSSLKQMAVKLNLMPRTMKGKEFLKRIFMGRLFPLPAEIEDGMAEYEPPVLIDHHFPNQKYKVIFALAHNN